jgi:hypothetical protein
MLVHPGTARSLPQHFGFKPGTTLIQQFGSTQQERTGLWPVRDDYREQLSQAQATAAGARVRPSTTGAPRSFARSQRFVRAAEAAAPGPGAYSPCSPPAHRSFQQPPILTGPAPAFNSTADGARVLFAVGGIGPGPVYTTCDVGLSHVRASPVERATAAHAAGGRARWSDTAPSAVFASKAARLGGWPGARGNGASPGPGAYSLGAGEARDMSASRSSPPFASREPRFRAQSARAAGSAALAPGPATYSPLKTHIAAPYAGCEPARPTTLPVSSSFAGPQRFKSTATASSEAEATLQHAHALVAALAEFTPPIGAGARGVRWPVGNRHLARLESRWRASAGAER